MTLEQLEETLPSGLHDAQIRSITRDFENGTLRLEMDILSRLPNDPPEKRDEYRKGSITFSGVKLFVIECPDASSTFLPAGVVLFSASRSEAGAFPADIVEKLPPATDLYSFFILEWLSHIHIAASDLNFVWDDKNGDRRN